MFRLPADDSQIWLVLATLGVWRLTALLCYDRGPFEILTRMRGWLAAVGLSALITCFHCAALWTSLAVVLISFERRPATALVALGVAGGASIVERWLTGEDRSERSEEPNA